MESRGDWILTKKIKQVEAANAEISWLLHSPTRKDRERNDVHQTLHVGYDASQLRTEGDAVKLNYFS